MISTSRSYNVIGLYDKFLIWLLGKEVYENKLQDMPNRLAITLNLAAILTTGINLLPDIIFGIYSPLPALLMLFFGGGLGVILFRFGKITTAKISVLTIYYLAVYMAVSADVYETGTHLYFITLSLAALVVFGFRQIYIGLAFTAFSTFLYFFSQLSEFSILPEFNFSPEAVDMFFIINLSSFTIISLIILLAYMKTMFSQAEMIKKQNEELIKTNKELDSFLYTTSHDLRAPLATLLGLLNITKDTKNLQEKQLYESLMEKSIFKMEEFIQEIIQFFKNSRLPVDHQKLNVDHLVNNLFEELSNQALLHEVKLNYEGQDDLEIISDQMRLRNILRNLLTNAIKYNDPDKEDKFVNVSIHPNETKVRFTVEDNGLGIDEEHMEKIFNMFYRASEKSKGAGLGLYIAYESAANIGGELKVQSKAREGSAFSLIIPKDNTNLSSSN